MSTIDDLAAALDGHQVTDDTGAITSEPAAEEVDSLVSETEPEETEEEPKSLDVEPEEAEDDKGNKYIPEKRFKKVWGEKKALEREIASLKQQVKPEKQAQEPLDRTQALEMEILFEKYPEFNPSDTRYSEELDSLAGKLIKANPSLTVLQAAREARDLASKIVGRVSSAKSETVVVKKAISDNGMVNAPRKVSSNIDPDSMSEGDLERYLKETGQW